METLHARLALLADDAPMGGAPPQELWASGKRAQRRRFAALTATLVVVAAVGAGVGIRLTDDGRSDVAPVGTVGFTLPIEYPAGQELPSLGETPGRLAAVWLVPRPDGAPPEVVGLVAETGTFGTLPFELPGESAPGDQHVSLSTDGRRIAHADPVRDGYPDPVGLIVRDLVTGESFESDFTFETRGVGYWVGATSLFGYVAGGSDADGYLWEPGKEPVKVNPYNTPYAGSDVSVASVGPGQPWECYPASIGDMEDWQRRYPGDEVPQLCSSLGIAGAEIVLGHWKDEDDANGTVVAVDLGRTERTCVSEWRCELSIDAAQRRVVVTSGAPDRVTFATDLIAVALDADGAS